MAPRPPHSDPRSSTILERVNACVAACQRNGVVWESNWQALSQHAMQQFLRPPDLCVFSDAVPQPLRNELLRQSLRSFQTPVLVCPSSWEPVARVLVLQQQREFSPAFLKSCMALCHGLRVRPVVLTVARSEREALYRQHLAEQELAAGGLLADFDFIVGSDVRTAVTSEARWRRCSHVFMERTSAPSWWRRLRGENVEHLLDGSGSLAFLAVPGRITSPMVKSEIESSESVALVR